MDEDTEVALLLGPRKKTFKSSDQLCDVLLRHFCCGDFEVVLTTCADHLAEKLWRYESNYSSLEENINSCIGNYMKDDKIGEEKIRCLNVLILGASCLQLFVQNNWTGPETSHPEEIFNSLFKGFRMNRKDLNDEQCVKILSLEGNLYPKVVFPQYLWMARLILCGSHVSISECWSFPWWSLRCVKIHQDVLQEKSPILREETLKYLEMMEQVEMLKTNENFNLFQIQFHLEVASLLWFYYEFSKSKEFSKTAKKLTGLDVSLTGALGRRTYHQTEDKAQLKLDISREIEMIEMETYNQPDLPKDVSLKDGTRRDKIAYQNIEDSFTLDLSPEEQAVVLTLFWQLQKSSAIHELMDEELLAYLTPIILKPKVWAVHAQALYHRSLIETTHHRSVERSMMQIEELINAYRRSSPKASERLDLFYAVSLPPIWRLEHKFADILLTLGAISNAVDIYRRLEIWDKVIQCYQIMQKKTQAEEIIREQLKEKETVNLWCSLGDVTNDHQYYEMAWKLSNERSAKAQRCLGQYYFDLKDYENCIPHFEKSLELNYLQLSVTNNLAYAAMKAEKWEIAASAYRKSLNLEPDNFQAWNNIANVYLKLNQKNRAWKALQEALRYDYNNWRIWENYLVVSLDCREIEIAINAYHELLNLKLKHVDVEVLTILVRAVIEGIPDTEENPCSHLKSKLISLFGRLTSQITVNSHVWSLYADLTAAESDPSVKEKVVQYRQKALGIGSQQPSWEKNDESRKHVFDLAIKLADESILFWKSQCQNRQMISSARLALRGLMTKLKQHQNSLLNDEAARELTPIISQLETKFSTLEELLKTEAEEILIT